MNASMDMVSEKNGNAVGGMTLRQRVEGHLADMQAAEAARRILDEEKAPAEAQAAAEEFRGVRGFLRRSGRALVAGCNALVGVAAVSLVFLELHGRVRDIRAERNSGWFGR